jgi:hypothetical protein
MERGLGDCFSEYEKSCPNADAIAELVPKFLEMSSKTADDNFLHRKK